MLGGITRQVILARSGSTFHVPPWGSEMKTLDFQVAGKAHYVKDPQRLRAKVRLECRFRM